MRWRPWRKGTPSAGARSAPTAIRRAYNATQGTEEDEELWRPIQAPPTARPWHTVRDTLERSAILSRTNPLAARLVQMTGDFIIGRGARLEGPSFAHTFWRHPQNRLEARLHRWCEELARSGELYLVLSRNPVDGMSYVREIPALQVDRIETAEGDYELELRYHQLTRDPDGRWWPSPDAPEADEADQVMLHYAVNRPVGEVRGVSDLAPILTWLERYEFWLEDRVRINRYKGAYLWHVKVENALPGQLEAKRAQYSRPPRSGSIIVTDGHETWAAIQPQIGADDVEADGKALRLMIAAGAGVPLHFLAEGEGANRATAREMGVAAYRHFAHRQRQFAWMVEDVIRWAARRAGEGEIAVRVLFDPIPETGEDEEAHEG